ncbi:MAG: metallophosphoesterase [Deltaproteobacteria bacterium]|nr:MAG: metallophosphoesterase [Deltaproteobacteria bacterium]
MIRLAHATDLHWFTPPSLRRVPGKRLLGTANLYLRGRVHHFDRTVQQAAVQAMLQAEPDIAVITGDLTALALPEEFELARRDLSPLLETVPTLVMNGNHDVYTVGSSKQDRIAERFGPFLHRIEGSRVARLDHDYLTLLALDPCRPHWSASGRLPSEQLDTLRAQLHDPSTTDRVVVIALHYPLLHPDGSLYDKVGHGLRNASDLIALLREAPVRPSAILHGHRHHGYRIDLDLGDAKVPIFNPGTGGQRYEPDHDRAACVNVYGIGPDGAVTVERHRHDGERFVPEPGGAYATGR